MTAGSDRLDRAWRDGVLPGDEDDLLAAACSEPDAASGLRAFADLAAALAGADRLDGMSAPNDPCERVIRRVAESLRDTAETRQLHEELEALKVMVAERDPRATAAGAWVRLAMAVAAGRESPTRSGRRLLRVSARDASAPVGVRLTAGSHLTDPDYYRPHAIDEWCAALDEYAGLAADHGLAAEAERAAVTAALVLLHRGHTASADRRLRKVLANPVADSSAAGALARLHLAALLPYEDAVAVLADGLARAARVGDYFAYCGMAVLGARLYLLENDAPRAVFTLTAAMHQLDRVERHLGDRLRDERRHLRTVLGEPAYQEACRQARDCIER